MNTYWLALTLLAQEPRDTGPEFGKASPMGLIVLVLLVLSTFLLVWSMNRQLRKVPKSFGDDSGDDAGDDSGDDVAGDGPADGDGPGRGSGG